MLLMGLRQMDSQPGWNFNGANSNNDRPPQFPLFRSTVRFQQQPQGNVCLNIMFVCLTIGNIFFSYVLQNIKTFIIVFMALYFLYPFGFITCSY